MADSAHAISNGYFESELSGNITCGVRGNCWFHCKKNIDKRLVSVKNPQKKSFLLASLYQLQVCQSPTIFKAASALFVLLCEADEDSDVVNFIKVFKAEWIDQNYNWFEGYNYPNNAGSPSTNNGNEACNGVIKSEDTLRELLPLYTFLLVSCQIVYKWSRARDPLNSNYKPFASEPTVTLAQWTLDYQYKKQHFNKIFQDKSDPNSWYVNCSDGIPIENSEVIKIYNKQMNECKWQTFDDFSNCAFGYWKISVDKDANETKWKKSTCTCPVYMKQYMCKHIIAIGILLKKVGGSTAFCC